MKMQVRASLLACISLVAGCASVQSPSPLPAKSMDEVNFELFSGYYCDNGGTWPNSLEDVRAWAATKNMEDTLGVYNEAVLSSPRRILLTVDYRPDSESEERKTVTFISPPSCGPENPAETSMAGGGVVLLLPKSFRPLTAVQMQERWGNGPYPDAAWEDSATSFIASIRFGELDVTADGLSTLQKPLESAYEQSVTNIDWKVRKFGKIDERPWIRLGYESDSTRGRLYNTSLSTTFQGKLLTIAFTSPAAEAAGLNQLAKDLVRNVRIGKP